MFVYIRRVRPPEGRIGFWQVIFTAGLILLFIYIVVPYLIIKGLIALTRWGWKRCSSKRGPGYSPQHSLSAPVAQPWRAPNTSLLDLLDE